MCFEIASKAEEHIRKLMIKDYGVTEVETRNPKANADNTRALIIRCPTVSDGLEAEGFLFHRCMKDDSCHNLTWNSLVLRIILLRLFHQVYTMVDMTAVHSQIKICLHISARVTPTSLHFDSPLCSNSDTTVSTGK
jgi:hypothetical protein